MGHAADDRVNGDMVRTLGSLEAALMECAWSTDRRLRVRDAQEMLANDGRTLAYTTVMTVMDNLHTKGWLRRERVGRGYVYEPTDSRAAYVAQLMNEALDASGDRPAAFLRFVSDMSDEDTAALTTALKQQGRSVRSP